MGVYREVTRGIEGRVGYGGQGHGTSTLSYPALPTYTPRDTYPPLPTLEYSILWRGGPQQGTGRL